MHVLVVTCAHQGDDARIVHRQARSLLEAGHHVILIAPPPAGDGTADPPGLARTAIVRARGRRRIRSWRAVRRAVRAEAPSADIVVLHDPELVFVAGPRVRRGRPTVWDVHEDFAASVPDRDWIPARLAGPVARLVRVIERRGSRSCHVIVAEHSYRTRFGAVPVVPNSTWVPADVAPYDEGRPRVVYVGRLSLARGVAEMVEVGRRLRGRVEVELIGAADGPARALLHDAAAAGDVTWPGVLPNPEALRRVEGALAGLSLLHDEPNYRHSQPTKIVEYLARGVPVITTPLPLAVDLVQSSGGGAVVPYGDVGAVLSEVEGLLTDRSRRDQMGASGHAYVLDHRSWQADGAAFVQLLESWASPTTESRAGSA